VTHLASPLNGSLINDPERLRVDDSGWSFPGNNDAKPSRPWFGTTSADQGAPEGVARQPVQRD
jgi:hypothetical protein